MPSGHEKRSASFFGWLTLRETISKRMEKRVPLGNWGITRDETNQTDRIFLGIASSGPRRLAPVRARWAPLPPPWCGPPGRAPASGRPLHGFLWGTPKMPLPFICLFLGGDWGGGDGGRMGGGGGKFRGNPFFRRKLGVGKQKVAHLLD